MRGYKRILLLIILLSTFCDLIFKINEFQTFEKLLKAQHREQGVIALRGSLNPQIKSKSLGMFSQLGYVKIVGDEKRRNVDFIYPETIIWSDFPQSCIKDFTCELHYSDFKLPHDSIDIARLISREVLSEIRIFENKERQGINQSSTPLCECIEEGASQKSYKQTVVDLILKKIELEESQEIKNYLFTVLAAVFGRGEYITESLYNLFHDAGLLHLLVISGYHLAMLMSLVGLITIFLTGKKVRLLYFLTRKQIEAILGLSLLIIFFITIDMNLPLWRAIISYVLFCYLVFQSFYILKMRLLIQSLIVLNLLFPLCFMTVSVQLTYAALLGLMLAKYISDHALFYKLRINKLNQYFLFNTCVYVCTIPIQYFWFDGMNPMSILYNVLFAVPFTFLTVVCGLFVTIMLKMNLVFLDPILSLVSKLYMILIEVICLVLSAL